MATYEVRHSDGSTEVLEAENVGEAKRKGGRLLPDVEVEHVTFLDDLDEADDLDDGEADEAEDEGEDEEEENDDEDDDDEE